jgi:predicted transcriptional regulator
MVPEWLDDGGRMQDMILSELDEHTVMLFKSVLSYENGLPLLRFLAINEHTLLTVEDIAFNMGLPYATVETCLHALMDMRLVRRIEVVGVVLFGLTDDIEMRKEIHHLVEWQERWQKRIARIAQVVEGIAPPPQRGSEDE